MKELQFVDLMGDGYILFDASKSLVECNAQASTWLKMDCQNNTFDSFVACFDAKDQIMLRNCHALAVTTGNAIKLDNIIHYKSQSGSGKYFKGSYICTEGAQVAFVFRDVTVSVSDELRTKIANNAFDSLPIGVIIADREHKIIRINEYAQKALKEKVDGLEGLYIGEIIQCENSQDETCGKSEFCEHCSINRAIRDIDMDLYTNQTVVATKRVGEGELKTFKVTVSKVTHESIVDLLITLQDITEQMHYEQTLRDARNEAEEANHLKTSFLSNMSHEIRTPLNGIIGMLDLSERLAKDDELLENLSIAKESSLNLLRIINSVLDLSKMEAGLFEIHKMPFNTDAFLNEIMNENRFKINNDRVELVRNYEKDYAIVTDRLRLKQVVNNLMDNAIKFTDKGYVKLYCKLVQEDDMAMLNVSISDTGIGISEEFKQKLFTSFIQADGSFTRQKGGTGLGLSISQKIVQKLGGVLEYKSNKQGGSEFYFSIPVEVLKDIAVQPLESKYPKLHFAKGDIDFKRRKVLLAEDDAVNQKIISKRLLMDDIEVIHANDGMEALELLRTHADVALILMDIQMPKMNGIEAVLEIRKHKKWKKLPIIALTALAMPEEKALILNSGFSDYISKPVQLDVLSQKIKLNMMSAKGSSTTVENRASEDKYYKIRSNILSTLNTGDQDLEKKLDAEMGEMIDFLDKFGLVELKDQMFKLQLDMRKEPVEVNVSKLYELIDTVDQILVV